MKRVRLTKKGKSFFSDVLFVSVVLLWVEGVDYLPFMQLLGLPMFIGSYIVWAKYSKSFEKFSKWVDRELQ